MLCAKAKLERIRSDIHKNAGSNSGRCQKSNIHFLEHCTPKGKKPMPNLQSICNCSKKLFPKKNHPKTTNERERLFCFRQRLAGQTSEKKSKKHFVSKRHVRETIQSQRPSTQGDVVLDPAPGWPNIQTSSVEPGPGWGTINQKKTHR